MSHPHVHPDADARPVHVAQGPVHQDLEAWIDHLIQLFTARWRHYDGSPITGEMRAIWRQGAHVQVRLLLSEMLETIVKRAVRRAWRKDVVDEFRPWERGIESRFTRLDPDRYDLSKAEDQSNPDVGRAFEVASAVEWALDRLNRGQRARVEVFLYEGATIQQVADRFEVSRRTVYRALREFKEGFEKALDRGRP